MADNETLEVVTNIKKLDKETKDMLTNNKGEDEDDE